MSKRYHSKLIGDPRIRIVRQNILENDDETQPCKPDIYSDGGILNNLPVSFFIDNDQQFIEHELGAYLRLMAFQFDIGIEKDILHSNKPVYRENWLLNFFYSFFFFIGKN